MIPYADLFHSKQRRVNALEAEVAALRALVRDMLPLIPCYHRSHPKYNTPSRARIRKIVERAKHTLNQEKDEKQ